MVTAEEARALKVRLAALAEQRQAAKAAGDMEEATRLGNLSLAIEDQLKAGREDLE